MIPFVELIPVVLDMVGHKQDKNAPPSPADQAIATITSLADRHLTAQQNVNQALELENISLKAQVAAQRDLIATLQHALLLMKARPQTPFG